MSAGPFSVAIWGASGATGSELLRQCLADERVGEVRAFVRSQLDFQHESLHQVVISDFLDPQSYRGELDAIDVVFWCLGVSQSAVRDEARYREITLDYTMTAARALQAASPDVAFHFVSAMGADSSGRLRPMWARVKGETEEALKEMDWRRLVIWRPSYIEVVGGRSNPTRIERLWEILSPLFRLFPSLVNTTTDIAAAMRHEAFDGGDTDRPFCEMRLAGDILRLARGGCETPD